MPGTEFLSREAPKRSIRVRRLYSAPGSAPRPSDRPERIRDLPELGFREALGGEEVRDAILRLDLEVRAGHAGLSPVNEPPAGGRRLAIDLVKGRYPPEALV